jgi:RNA polymerase sigma-70 factor, ECF subfamily
MDSFNPLNSAAFPHPAETPPEGEKRVPGTRETREADALLRSILEDYGDWLRRTLHRLCPRYLGIQVEDVEQEVALRLWRALRRPRPIRHLSSYLHRTAASATIDAVRRARQRQGVEDPLPEEREEESGRELASPRPSPESEARKMETVERAQRLLAGLPENRRRAAGLYLQGFNTREIAELMGWTEAKARNLAHRGVAAVRRQLMATGYHHGEG